MPLISIIESTCQEAIKYKIKKIGLFGTKYTMIGGFYQEIFNNNDIEIVVPDELIMNKIHKIYMEELVKGVIKNESKKELLFIANNLINKNNIEALILGGTELPLLLHQTDLKKIKLLDTTLIHVNRTINYAIS